MKTKNVKKFIVEFKINRKKDWLVIDDTNSITVALQSAYIRIQLLNNVSRKEVDITSIFIA